MLMNDIKKIMAKYKPDNINWNAVNFKDGPEPDVEEIARRSQDRGFFHDIVGWLGPNAPKRLKRLLWDLSLADAVSYERLCKAVVSVEFRASEVIERRMALGPVNEWVRQYFRDFPPAGPRS